jgi:hypothetical protein
MYAIRLVTHRTYKLKGRSHVSGLIEHPWVRNNSEKATENYIGHSIGLITVDDTFQPVTIGCVIRRVGAVGVDQYVNVG